MSPFQEILKRILFYGVLNISKLIPRTYENLHPVVQYVPKRAPTAMKVLFMLSFFLFIAQTLSAQDLIITTEGESLDCKITRVEKEHIFFTYQYMGEIRESSIPIELVKNFKTNHHSAVNHSLLVPGIGVQTFPQLIFAINTGLSYRTGHLPEGMAPALKDYMQGMKIGYHLGGHFGCLVNEQWGFGLKANRFRSRVSRDNIAIKLNNGSLIYGKMEDNIAIIYVGPVVSSSFLIEPNQSFLFARFSAGLIHYNNEATFIDPFIMRGNSLGFTIDLGYDVPLSQKLAFGVQLSYVAGYLTQLEVEKGSIIETIFLSKESYENLSRLDLSVGIRFK